MFKKSTLNKRQKMVINARVNSNKRKYEKAYKLYSEIFELDIKENNMNEIGNDLLEMFRIGHHIHTENKTITQIEDWRKHASEYLLDIIDAIDKQKRIGSTCIWSELLNITINLKNNDLYQRVLYGKANCLSHNKNYDKAWKYYMKIYEINDKTLETIISIGDVMSDKLLDKWCREVENIKDIKMIDYLEKRLYLIIDEDKKIKKNKNDANKELMESNEELNGKHGEIESSIKVKENCIERNKDLLQSQEAAMDSERINIQREESYKENMIKELEKLHLELNTETNPARVTSIQQQIGSTESRIRSIEKRIMEINKKIGERKYETERIKSRILSLERSIEEEIMKLNAVDKSKVNIMVIKDEMAEHLQTKYHILLLTWENIFYSFIDINNCEILLNKANFLINIDQYEKAWNLHKQYFTWSPDKKKNIINMYSLACEMEQKKKIDKFNEWKNLLITLKSTDEHKEVFIEIRDDLKKRCKFQLLNEIEQLIETQTNPNIIQATNQNRLSINEQRNIFLNSLLVPNTNTNSDLGTETLVKSRYD